ncbi:hypothetical protein VCHA36P166_130033 [Vibrio chagasii]|nr:hypothetical protein VCHA36P166_130033 [Vibrio chagasii]
MRLGGQMTVRSTVFADISLHVIWGKATEGRGGVSVCDNAITIKHMREEEIAQRVKKKAAIRQLCCFQP